MEKEKAQKRRCGAERVYLYRPGRAYMYVYKRCAKNKRTTTNANKRR